MIEKIKKHKKELYVYGGSLLAFLLIVIIAVTSLNGSPMDTSINQSANKTAINLGFAEIAWYAVFILTGIVIAAVFSFQEFKRIGWDTEILYDGLLFAVPLAIIGSRLYYVIFDPTPNYNNFIDVINITSGGLAIHGAVITTFIFVIFFAKWKKINFWALADIIVVGFLIGQIIGRWGNFMNGEAHGPIIESQFMMQILPKFIVNNMTNPVLAVTYHPTFFYESLWNFVGLIAFLVIRRQKVLKVGDLLALYLIWYGIGRGLIIEPMRQDPLYIFGLKVNVVFSLTLFAGGGVLLLILKRIFLKDQKYYVDMLVPHENDSL